MNHQEQLKFKRAVSRAVRSAFKQGLDPVINPKLFHIEVSDRIKKWFEKNKEIV